MRWVKNRLESERESKSVVSLVSNRSNTERFDIEVGAVEGA